MKFAEYGVGDYSHFKGSNAPIFMIFFSNDLKFHIDFIFCD